jgi:hypothetical protein
MYKCFKIADAEYVYPWLKPQFLYNLLQLQNPYNNFNKLT